MRISSHQVVALAAVAVAILISLQALFTSGSGYVVNLTELRVAPTKRDLIIVPASKAIEPLVPGLSGVPPVNPFTLRGPAMRKLPIPLPPPPPVELPPLPVLPIPEK
jgi:hypothetical protein